ncbi:MAG: metallopeptidase TldD-related protein [Myxococcota bacterium]
MSTREIIEAHSSSIKLGVVNSQIASVRTQVENETAVRVYKDDCVGVASAVGDADLEALTQSATDALIFEIPYPVAPESDRVLSTRHEGTERNVSGLVSVAEEVLDALRTDFPNFVFSHGVEQNKVGWRIHNEIGLMLDYQRITTQVAFVAKEKGSGNIIDTFVGVEGPTLDVDGMLTEFRSHLSAYAESRPARTGRQRVIFPGLAGMASAGLFQMLRSDLSATSYAQGASLFEGKVGDGRAWFSDKLDLFDCRDPELQRVCPFDMEGVVRDSLNLDIVNGGRLMNIAASKRDAERYGLPSTGTAVGGVSQLPVSGFGALGGRATAPKLADLLDDDGGLLVWFVAGGDTTRTGDMAFPAMVVLEVDAAGRPIGRVPGCTLTGNIFDVFGDDFVGITNETVDPFSTEPFFVTHMNVNAAG